MRGITAALFRRELGRLAAGRVFLAGGLVALLFVSLALFAVVSELVAQSDPAEKVAFLRTAGFQETGGYENVVFLFVIFLGVSQIGGDVRAGTIFGILARPLSRARLFLTGWAASALTVLVLEILRSGPILGCAAWIEGRVHLLPILGVLALWLGQVAALAGFAALGAVMPPAYAALAGLAVVFTTGFGYSDEFGGLGATLVDTACWFLPLFSKQGTLIDAAIQGSARDAGPILEVIAHRTCWALLLLALGVYGFNRRDLAPRV